MAHQIWFCAKSCSGEVGQAGVFGAPDAVLGAGSAAVPQLEVGQLPAAGVGDERGDPVPVEVGDAQLRAGVWSFLAHDQPHPGWPAREVEHLGPLAHPCTGTDLPVGVIPELAHLLSA